MTLSVHDLEKRFGSFRAVSGVSFELGKGQFLSLLGPSGCGKTTTLRMIAGFEHPDAGSITLSGRDVTGVAARRRNIGMVFQHYALFPHMTVAENVAFGLRMRRVPSADTDRRVQSALALARMEDFAGQRPAQLSGGQQQRVALARALVIEPDILLLDEPLSALDLKLREELREEISRITRELDITTVFVTHDQNEALVLSDLVAVMNAGRVEHLDTPERVYNKPRTSFVADFLGGANLLHGRIVSGPTGRCFTWQGVSIPVPEDDVQEGPATASIRPEDLRLSGNGTSTTCRAVVERRRFLGSTIDATLRMPEGQTLSLRCPADIRFQEGDVVDLHIPTDRLVLLEGQTGRGGMEDKAGAPVPDAIIEA